MKIRIFGESHAPEIGVEIDGVPAGTRIDMDELQAFLDRRAPGRGQGGLSTPRREPDRPEFTAGIVDGVADGSTIRAVIRNTNIRPQDYAGLRERLHRAASRPRRLRIVAEVREDTDRRREVVGTDDRPALHRRRHRASAAGAARGVDLVRRYEPSARRR